MAMKTGPFQKPPYNAEDWITREQVCELLKIKPKTLSNMLSAGTIPGKFISTGPSGAKFFHRPGLMGF